MRRLLAGSVAGASLLAFLAVPARAQYPVIDVAALGQLYNQLNQMQRNYQVYMQIYGSLIRMVDPNSLRQDLMGSQPMPSAPNIGQILQGTGNFGSMGGTAGQYLSANTVYIPPSTGAGDFNAALIQRNANSLAGLVAMAETSINSIQSHIAGLATIQAQLSTVTNQTDLAAIQGRLQAEQANISAQGVQAQSVSAMMEAQRQQYELQQMQQQRKSADDLMASVSTGTAGIQAPQLTASNLPTFSVGP
jgi:hypothetical protein